VIITFALSQQQVCKSLYLWCSDLFCTPTLFNNCLELESSLNFDHEFSKHDYFAIERTIFEYDFIEQALRFCEWQDIFKIILFFHSLRFSSTVPLAWRMVRRSIGLLEPSR
jgi:hypothetical protein